MAAHHIAALASVAASAFQSQGAGYTLALLATEISTPFINARWLLDKAVRLGHTLSYTRAPASGLLAKRWREYKHHRPVDEMLQGFSERMLYTVNGIVLVLVWFFGRIVLFFFFFHDVYKHWGDVQYMSPFSTFLVVVVVSSTRAVALLYHVCISFQLACRRPAASNGVLQPPVCLERTDHMLYLPVQPPALFILNCLWFNKIVHGAIKVFGKQVQRVSGEAYSLNLHTLAACRQTLKTY